MATLGEKLPDQARIQTEATSSPGTIRAPRAGRRGGRRGPLTEESEDSVDASAAKQFSRQWMVEIKKLDADKRRVFGYALISRTRDGSPVVDLQGDTVDPEEMEEAAYEFVKSARVGGEMHQGPAHATLIESFAITPDKAAALGIPHGTLPTAHYVGFEVPPETFQRVKAGQRLMFSIEGSAERELVGAA